MPCGITFFPADLMHPAPLPCLLALGINCCPAKIQIPGKIVYVGFGTRFKGDGSSDSSSTRRRVSDQKPSATVGRRCGVAWRAPYRCRERNADPHPLLNCLRGGTRPCFPRPTVCTALPACPDVVAAIMPAGSALRPQRCCGLVHDCKSHRSGRRHTAIGVAASGRCDKGYQDRGGSG